MADKKNTKSKATEMSLLRRFIKKVDPGSVLRDEELFMHPAAKDFMRRRRKKLDPGSVVREGEKSY